MEKFFRHKNFIKERKWKNRLFCVFFFFIFHLKSLFKKIEFVLIASITSDVHLPRSTLQPIFHQLAYLHAPIFICKNLFLFMIICAYLFFFCKNLFLSMIICENLFFFVRIIVSPSYLWESLIIYDHLWESSLKYDHLLEHLFAFYRPYENKQV